MMLLLAAAAAALAALAHAAPTPQAPSLRNGLPGTALAHHRWLSVEAPASGGLAQQHALEASLLAAGVPAHLAWVNDQGALELIVPPALEPAVAELLRGREHSVLRPDAQAWLEMEKEERRLHVPLVDRSSDIPPPVLIGVVGPPGTGKSSLIKCISESTGRHVVNIPLKVPL